MTNHPNRSNRAERKAAVDEAAEQIASRLVSQLYEKALAIIYEPGDTPSRDEAKRRLDASLLKEASAELHRHEAEQRKMNELMRGEQT